MAAPHVPHDFIDRNDAPAFRKKTSIVAASQIGKTASKNDSESIREEKRLGDSWLQGTGSGGDPLNVEGGIGPPTKMRMVFTQESPEALALFTLSA